MGALKMEPFPPNDDGEMTEDELGRWLDFTYSVGAAHDIRVTRWEVDRVFDFTQVPFPHARWINYSGHGWTDDDMRFLPMNSTWLDIWKQIERLVVCGTDQHHVCIVDVWCSDEGAVTFMTES